MFTYQTPTYKVLVGHEQRSRPVEWRHFTSFQFAVFFDSVLNVHVRYKLQFNIINIDACTYNQTTLLAFALNYLLGTCNHSRRLCVSVVSPISSLQYMYLPRDHDTRRSRLQRVFWFH